MVPKMNLVRLIENTINDANLAKMSLPSYDNISNMMDLNNLRFYTVLQRLKFQNIVCNNS